MANDSYSHFDVLLNDSPVMTQTECTNDWTQAYVDIPDGTNEVSFVFSQRYAMNNPLDNKGGNAVTNDAVWLKDIALSEIPDANSVFDWTPGSAPTGDWFTSWGGENKGAMHKIIGPDGLSTNLHVTYLGDGSDAQKWIPWNSTASAMGKYTFLAYGNIDEVDPDEGKLGVLWDMGFKDYNKTMLIKDAAGNVKLIQANGSTINKCIDAGKVEGYHLFTVRFSDTNGASLQIDNGEVHSDSTFTQVSDRGLQVGSILGGLPSNFDRGVGFAVLKMIAFGTDSIPSAQYKRLCEEYPAVTNRVLATIGGKEYYRLRYLVDDLPATDSFTVTGETAVDFESGTISCALTGEMYNLGDLDLAISDGGDGVVNIAIDESKITHDCVLRISEIMPKPTDAQNHGALEGMDVNGLESGWVEVENTSDMWADLKDYRFTRTNRGKKSNQADYGNFPSRLVAPHGRAIFYTSERYSNSKDQTVSAFASGNFKGKPEIFAAYGNILVWGDKVNPKKSPFVRLYYMPDAATTNVVDTVVVPNDLPEGWSIIVGDAAENEGTRRWMCPTPTRGAANTATNGLKRIGPNVGPLYEISSLEKTDVESEFALPVSPAKTNEDYAITVAVNPVMNPDGTFKPRTKDAIKSLRIVYRSDLDDSTLGTNVVDLTTKDTDKKAWGDKYTAYIRQSALPEAGHLVQWKFLIEDNEGTEWTSPSFNNPDDGYEWYGTIVEPDPETQMSATLLLMSIPSMVSSFIIFSSPMIFGTSSFWMMNASVDSDVDMPYTAISWRPRLDMILATRSGLYAISPHLMVMTDMSDLLVTLLTRDPVLFLTERMVVPGFSGWNELRILTVMRLVLAGSMVLGCRTLAPKYASSAASP